MKITISFLIIISLQLISYILSSSLQRKNKLKAKQSSFQIPITWSPEPHGVINIGTPVQHVTVLFDAGAILAWTFGSNAQCCKTPTSCIVCPPQPFNQTLSSTYSTKNKPNIISFIDGQSNNGIYAYDTFQLGNAPAIANFPVTIMLSASGIAPGSSGEVGMGYNYGSQTSSSYVQALYNSKQITSNLWAAYTPQTGSAYFQIGSYDTTSYPNLQWFPCNTISMSWTVQYNSVNGIAAPSSTSYFVVDTGNTVISLPHSLNTTAFWSTISANKCYLDINGNINCACKSASDINPLVLNLTSLTGSSTIQISSKNLIKSMTNGICLTVLMYSQNPTLGTPWITNNYMVFNYGSVSGGIGNIGMAPYSWAI